ncbi:MAG: methyltransferase domain-containing protein [Deltaproteobacteria bacterium]|nr:methyltransferase domain-containing protein [Deltaproteobacteria bacterium]
MLTQCRMCGSADLHAYLDLGATPLADAFVKQPDIAEPYFPLAVQYCAECSLSQLTVVVDPRLMFGDYCYRSSISGPFRDHCRGLVQACADRLGTVKAALAVDIASNDGCLLSAFREAGSRVLGVEPARNIARIAEEGGIPTVSRFWCREVAEAIRRDTGPARVITGTNVFAHVDDVGDFVESVAALLDDTGIFVLEFPHMVDLVRHSEFDTIYHEHLSYFLLRPLVRLFERYAMTIFDVEKVAIHGGSLRVFAKKTSHTALPVRDSVQAILAEEETLGFYRLATYHRFADRVATVRRSLTDFFTEIVAAKKTVVGYGATAKGNTLLNCCRIGPEHLAMIIDETPQKQGLFTPGRNIPIRGREALEGAAFDYMLILAWNYKDAIMRKTEAFRRRGGKYIIPIPEVTVL